MLIYPAVFGGWRGFGRITGGFIAMKNWQKSKKGGFKSRKMPADNLFCFPFLIFFFYALGKFSGKRMVFQS